MAWGDQLQCYRWSQRDQLCCHTRSGGTNYVAMHGPGDCFWGGPFLCDRPIIRRLALWDTSADPIRIRCTDSCNLDKIVTVKSTLKGLRFLHSCIKKSEDEMTLFLPRVGRR